MNKKRGFTLIELLAVIIILGIIALIAVPAIMNTLDKAEKNAFEDTAYGLIKAGEVYYSEKRMEGIREDKIFTFPGATGLDIKGDAPESGTMKIDKQGRIEMAISNGVYCARKSKNSEKVTIDTDIENCKIVSSNPIIINPSNNCVKNGTCTLDEIKAGISVQIQVNESDIKNFHVVNDDGNKLTLIMDNNFDGKIAWLSEADWTANHASGESYLDDNCRDKGPLTILNFIETNTSGWTNINFDYILSDDIGNAYSDITKTGVHARLLTYTEASNLGCSRRDNSCPSWLYANLIDGDSYISRAFWLSSGGSEETIVWMVMNTGGFSGTFPKNDFDGGPRPVIEILKNI